MAKVQGPLMSMDASGTLAGAMTFGKWKGRPTVRVRVTPANPRTAAQVAVRSSMAGLTQLYKANKALLDTNFATRALQRNISKFNAFTGFNQKRLNQGFFPANSLSPSEAAPANNATALAATVSGKYVRLTWTDALAADAWTFFIYRNLTTAPAGTTNQLVGVVKRGVQVLEDGPLAAGTWQYVIAAVSTNGGRTVVSTAVSAIVS